MARAICEDVATFVTELKNTEQILTDGAVEYFTVSTYAQFSLLVLKAYSNRLNEFLKKSPLRQQLSAKILLCLIICR